MIPVDDHFVEMEIQIQEKSATADLIVRHVVVIVDMWEVVVRVCQIVQTITCVMHYVRTILIVIIDVM